MIVLTSLFNNKHTKKEQNGSLTSRMFGISYNHRLMLVETP